MISRMIRKLPDSQFRSASSVLALLPVATVGYVHHRGRRGERRAMIPKPTPTATPYSNTIAMTT
jgi:hypothetical protein